MYVRLFLHVHRWRSIAFVGSSTEAIFDFASYVQRPVHAPLLESLSIAAGIRDSNAKNASFPSGISFGTSLVLQRLKKMTSDLGPPLSGMPFVPTLVSLTVRLMPMGTQPTIGIWSILLQHCEAFGYQVYGARSVR